MIQEAIEKKYTSMTEAVKLFGKPSHTIRNYSKRLEPFKEYGNIHRGRFRGEGAEYLYTKTQLAWLQQMIALLNTNYYTMHGAVHFTYEYMTLNK